MHTDRQGYSTFSSVVWAYALVLLLMFIGASQLYPLLIFPIVLIAGVMFAVPFFGPKEVLPARLIAATVAMAVLMTALYAPILGVFMGLQGFANTTLVKVSLGIRSAHFALMMFIALIFAASLLRNRRLGTSAALILMALTIGMLNGSIPLEPRITYLFNSFFPLFAAVALIPVIEKYREAFTNYGRVMMHAGLLIAFISVLYYPLLNIFFDVFRPDLALIHQSSSFIGNNTAETGSPTQWTTLLYDMRIQRFVGTFPNPILFGYFCSILSFALFVKSKYLWSGLIAVLTVLSLSKGAILLLASTHVLYQISKRGNFLFLISVFLLVAAELTMAYLLDGSNRVHLRGLQGGFRSVIEGGISSISIGFGIGSGGNLARGQLSGGAFSSGWLASGSESGIGVLTYQLGFAGLLLLCYLIFDMYRKLRGEARGAETQIQRNASHAVIALSFSWFSNMLLQEDLINVTIVSMMIYGILIIYAPFQKQEMRTRRYGAIRQRRQLHHLG